MANGQITRKEAFDMLIGVQQTLASHKNTYEVEENQSLYSSQYDDIGGVCTSTTNLANMPESEWGTLRVSKKSYMFCHTWDFQDEGSPLYVSLAKINWAQDVDEGITLNSIECNPLRRLLAACLYYYLPQNCVLGSCRSYNSVIPMYAGFLKIARFLYRRGFYFDRCGNGVFKDSSSLSVDDIISCLEEESSVNARSRLAHSLRFWQKLSQSGFLPNHYKLHVAPVTDEMMRKLLKQKEDNAGTYLPISLETLSVVVPHCINLVEKYAEDIIGAYNILHPLYANKQYKNHTDFTWANAISYLNSHKSEIWCKDDFVSTGGTINNPEKNELLKQICNHIDWPFYRDKYFPIKGKHIAKAPHSQIVEIAKEMNIDLFNVGIGTIPYDLRKIRTTFQGIFTTFRDACLILLCLVTGMRRSELLHVEANKAWLVPGSDNEYYLEFTVFKTDEASQGAPVVIPIPEVAFKAYTSLERITERARYYGKTDYLSVNITFCFGGKMHINRISTILDRFWLNLGIEENIHSHMFRKTLAMFAVYQDPRNISVIKYLFSHKSLAMTLAYIVKIPGMSDDIKLAIIEHNMELLCEVIVAAKNEKIGGKCGLRIKEQLKTSQLFARLNDDGRETLHQYVDSLLENGLRILHRCPMNVICTNMHDSIAHIGPDLCDCEVTNCDYAIFIEDSTPQLIEEIMFHEKFILRDSISADQRKFSQRKINDSLERLAEIQGRDSVMAQFPHHYGLVA